ncbi:MAG: cation diffusion facilitator family transporter [Thaumarchaeota archaeon]|nr:cation diffusion facilitator family transporter [Nitrososphaerota archaeon]
MENHHAHMVTLGDRKTLTFVLFLTAIYLAVEVVGGLLTNSLALLSDAGHMVSDVGGLAISLVAVTLACQPSTPERPFGLRRVEILAALVNGIVLIAIDIYILYESYQRFLSPQPVQSAEMLAVAVGGLLINLASAKILSRASKRSLNIRSAFIHVIADALGSVGVIAAGILMFFTGIYILDAIAGMLIAIIIIPSIYQILKESSNILLESCPSGVEIYQVKNELRNVQDVKDVHDLHVWSISSGIHSLSVHLVIDSLGQGSEVLRNAKQMLEDKFEINHATIQIEEHCEDELIH